MIGWRPRAARAQFKLRSATQRPPVDQIRQTTHRRDRDTWPPAPDDSESSQPPAVQLDVCWARAALHGEAAVSLDTGHSGWQTMLDQMLSESHPFLCETIKH
jgi:hypothetical protein